MNCPSYQVNSLQATCPSILTSLRSLDLSEIDPVFLPTLRTEILESIVKTSTYSLPSLPSSSTFMTNGNFENEKIDGNLKKVRT